MGATSWRYYTPYLPDPEAALQALRSQVFTQGQYCDPCMPFEASIRRTAQRLGEDADGAECRALIDRFSQVERSVRTGDLQPLSRKDQALVRRLREVSHLAAQLGAIAPTAITGPPSSIDELLARAAECGTHSVLDIEHVSVRPGFGLAVPMTAAALHRWFRTSEPTHGQVERVWPDIAERLERWQARCLVAYRRGKPHEYAFVGCSGD